MQLVTLPGVSIQDFDPNRILTPAVVVGSASGWNALEGWTPEYLKAVAGDQSVSVRNTSGAPQNIYHRLEPDTELKFAEYLNWVLSTAEQLTDALGDSCDVGGISRAVTAKGMTSSHYLDIELERLSARLARDIDVPEWYRIPPAMILFWCGVLGTSSGLHSDEHANCNVQIFGKKHFVLFSPNQVDLFERIPGRTQCRFDPNLPDFDRFPLARNASGYECWLNPGDSLHIPPKWLHQVTVVSTWAINVNFFWSLNSQPL